MRLLFLSILLGGVMVSCERELQVEQPTLKVEALNYNSKIGDTLVYKIGDTTRFSFQNESDNILFYSGEPQNNYDYAERTKAEGTAIMSFSSKMEWGNQLKTLQVLAIKNMANADSATVVNAEWIDITDKAIWSTTNAVTASGKINLQEALKLTVDDYAHVAFRYRGKTGSTQRTWTITNLLFQNELTEGNSTIGNLSTDATLWKIVTISPSTGKWVPTTAQLQVVGGAATAPDNESWVVSKPLYFSNVLPDPAVVVKSLNSSNVGSMKHVFKKTGVYSCYFIGVNVTADARKESVQKIIVKIIN